MKKDLIYKEFFKPFKIIKEGLKNVENDIEKEIYLYKV